MKAGATRYYYLFDSLRSVIGLTDASGSLVEAYRYNMYGQPLQASMVGNPYMFTGRRFDSETGLYYYRARYYSPQLRRFIEPDPIGFEGGMNLYAYVGNDPGNAVDPWGLTAEDAWRVWHGFVTSPDSLKYGVARAKSMWDPTPVYGLPFTQQFLNRLLYQDSNGIDVTAYSDGQLACEYRSEVNEQFALIGAAAGFLIGGGYRGINVVKGGTFPDEKFSSKAPNQVSPGTRVLEGQYIDDLGRVRPWQAHYDEYGRLVGRTDYNAANSAHNIPFVHYHTYEWGPGKTPMETGSHIPGEYKP